MPFIYSSLFDVGSFLDISICLPTALSPSSLNLWPWVRICEKSSPRHQRFGAVHIRDLYYLARRGIMISDIFFRSSSFGDLPSPLTPSVYVPISRILSLLSCESACSHARATFSASFFTRLTTITLTKFAHAIPLLSKYRRRFEHQSSRLRRSRQYTRRLCSRKARFPQHWRRRRPLSVLRPRDKFRSISVCPMAPRGKTYTHASPSC